MAAGTGNGSDGPTVLQQEVRDLLALETRLHAWVQAELASGALADHPDARALLRRIEPRVFAHQSALEQVLEPLHGRASTLRRALAAALGRFVHRFEAPAAAPKSSSDLCELYILMSATAAGYLVLATTARALADEQTCTLAESGADDTNEFLDEIALLLPELTRAEIAGSDAATASSGS